MFYLYEKTSDTKTKKVTYKFKVKMDKLVLPRGGEYEIFKGKNYKHHKLSVNLKGGYFVEEDSDRKLIEDAANLVTIAYNEMVKDIYTLMYTVFDTNSAASATAFAATWEAMKSRPENYVDIGLGLPDKAAVIAYADIKLSSADGYGVYRLKRIAQFVTEKTTILGE